MLAALLTTLAFALSAVSGQRVAMKFGGLRGNFLRLLFSTLVLGTVVAIWFPGHLAWPTFSWYFISGIIGFGLGDVALFLGYERLGSRLTVLINLCLAPLFAAAVEWLWLGNLIPPVQLTASAVILVGVGLALKPGTPHHHRRGSFGWGVVAAVLAGFGQGTGAVVSRKALEVEALIGIDGNGISAAFQRVLAGMIVGGLAVAWRAHRNRRTGFRHDLPERQPRDWFWLATAALAGPVIGVSFFQWALVDLESGVVLAIVATTPIVLMPLAHWTESDRPTSLSITGAVIAVSGVVLLHRFNHLTLTLTGLAIATALTLHLLRRRKPA